MRDERMKPCPFCGNSVKLQLCDSEGNFRRDEYLEDAWSGISYVITHDLEDIDVDCVISTFYGESLGCLSYDSVEEAIEAWNQRV